MDERLILVDHKLHQACALPSISVPPKVRHARFTTQEIVVAIFRALGLDAGLPIRVKAYFRLHVHRRVLWLPAPDLEGDHVLWARWNKVILELLVPSLYAKALVWLAERPLIMSDHGLHTHQGHPGDM